MSQTPPAIASQPSQEIENPPRLAFAALWVTVVVCAADVTVALASLKSLRSIAITISIIGNNMTKRIQVVRSSAAIFTDLSLLKNPKYKNCRYPPDITAIFIPPF